MVGWWGWSVSWSATLWVSSSVGFRCTFMEACVVMNYFLSLCSVLVLWSCEDWIWIGLGGWILPSVGLKEVRVSNLKYSESHVCLYHTNGAPKLRRRDRPFVRRRCRRPSNQKTVKQEKKRPATTDDRRPTTRKQRRMHPNTHRHTSMHSCQASTRTTITPRIARLWNLDWH